MKRILIHHYHHVQAARYFLQKDIQMINHPAVMQSYGLPIVVEWFRKNVDLAIMHVGTNKAHAFLALQAGMQHVAFSGNARITAQLVSLAEKNGARLWSEVDMEHMLNLSPADSQEKAYQMISDWVEQKTK